MSSSNFQDRVPDIDLEIKEKRAGTFSYDPSKIRDKSVNQMRFELSDVYVDDEVNTCMLSDEEYKAIIDDSKSWKEAKIAILKQIIFMFSLEVDYTIDGLSLKLSDRYNRFKKMLDDLLKEDALPLVDDSLLSGGGGHYFYYGMLENPRK